MIFEIVGKDSKAFSQDIKNVLNYSAQKEELENGHMIYNNTFSDDVNEIAAAFQDAMETNPNIRKEKLLHISASLSPGESMSDEKFVDVCNAYLVKMGYVNTPTVMYRHTEEDKKEHVHIILSNVSFEGKKLSQWNDFFKSQSVSRELEKQFGLIGTEYKREKNSERLAEINARKYRVVNAVKRAISEKKEKDLLHFLKGHDLEEVSKKDDNQLKALLGPEFDKLRNFVHNQGLVYYTEKEQFAQVLGSTVRKSNSLDDFYKGLEEKGIYYDLKLLQGETTLTYGIPEKSFYVQEKDLPKYLTHASLKLQFEKLVASPRIVAFPKDEKQVKQFLRRNVKRVLQSSRNLNELEVNLSQRGIGVQTSSNSAGIYGVSFFNLSDKENIFKASDLDRLLSWKNIEDIMKANEHFAGKKDEKVNIKTETRSEPSVGKKEEQNKNPDLSKLGKAFDGQDDSPARKKKKKEDENEKDNNLSI